MSRSVFALVVLALTAGAGAAPAPAAEKAKAPAKRPPRVFLITDYLQGTADEIGKKVNGETRRLLERKKSLTAEIEALEKGATAGQGEALQRLRKSKAYLKAKQDVTRAEQELNRVRRSGTTKQKTEASSRFNRAREAVRKMEAAAGGPKDPAARLAAAKEELAHCEESLVKAAKWRAHLIHAARNGMLIFGPIKVGGEGILGRVRVVDVRDGRNVVVEYMAPHEGKSLGTKEGFQAVEVDFESTTVRIRGMDTAGLKQGEMVLLDRNFVIIEETPVPGRASIYVAEPKPNGVEELFARMTDLDGQVPAFPPEEVEVAEDPNAASAPGDQDAPPKD